MSEDKDRLIELSYPVYLQCGHVSNRYKADGSPCCVFCQDDNEFWDKVAEQVPFVQGRMAVCHVCRQTRVESELMLQDFRYCGEGSYVARETCVCGFKKALHRFGGYYPGDMFNGSPIRIHGICINEGGFWREHGPYDEDLFYCGCVGDF